MSVIDIIVLILACIGCVLGILDRYRWAVVALAIAIILGVLAS